MTEIGKTGKFPQGKISQDDEGEIKLLIAADKEKKVVVIHFGTPVVWLGLPKKEAMEFAAKILTKCKDLDSDPEDPKTVMDREWNDYKIGG